MQMAKEDKWTLCELNQNGEAKFFWNSGQVV